MIPRRWSLFAAVFLPPLLAWGGAGKTALEFLSEPPGARSAAMGGVASAAADDVESSLFNPAALADLRQRQVSAGYVSLFDGMNQASLAYAHPLTLGAWSASMRTQSSGEIASYDAGDGRQGTFDASDTVFSAGYGRASGSWRWGINLKQASQSVAGHTGRASALDGGLLYRRVDWPVTLSAGLRNVGGKVSLGASQADLPRSLDVGAAGRFLGESLLVAVESRRGADGENRYAAGAEAWMYNILGLRAGWQAGDRTGNGLSMGVGFKLRELRVDYSFSPEGDGFNPSHRMGLSWRFGRAGERSYQDGLRLLQSGRTDEAVLKFQEAVDADPNHARAIRALREAVKRLEAEMREEAVPGAP